MSGFSLYGRLRTFGTISNSADDIPDVLFALPSTVNWLRALSILVGQNALNFQSSRIFYANVQRRHCADSELNTVYEQLLFSLNQIASLRGMASVPNKADVARMGIVAWYYSIYGSASAMIAAADGSFQENHTGTANQWDRIFSANGLVMDPFGDRLSNLIQSTVNQELIPVRERGRHSLVTVPQSSEQAWGCIAEYLSGCAKWTQENLNEKIRKRNDFRSLGVSDFRTTAARRIRDEVYQGASVSFLHQAFRYRGKANYRDAIFLAYGNGVPSIVNGLVDDLADVATAFSAMAAGYVSRRIGADNWNAFVDDLERKRSVSVSPLEIWA